MSTDKVGSPCSTPRKLKFEQLRADYELFLQTFEKPTWIYRLLQRRQHISPFMLPRNLSYLKGRRLKGKPKQQDKRAAFKFDNLLHRLHEIYAAEVTLVECENMKHYLNLSFGGFFHGPGFAEDIFLTNDPKLQSIFKDDFVSVNIHLIQVYHRRKRDKDQPMDVTLLGVCQAPWNPRSQLLLPSQSVQLSIPPSAFADNGRAIKTHILSVTVSIVVPKKVKKKRGRKKKDSNVLTDSGNTQEPPSKRVKSDTAVEYSPEDNDVIDMQVEKTLASFSAELIVYDRHKNCLLIDGDYELLLQENVESIENSKNSSWESKFKNKLGPFAAFSFGPTIKFSLRWDSKPSVPVATVHNSLSDPYTNKQQPLSKSLAVATSEKTKNDEENTPKVFYQFIYNNSTRQQTEAREGTSCPWCALNCKRLYGLLKHLKCCHSRFSFLYTVVKKGHRIDVCVNDNFEGTLGFDRDMGFINVDDAPVKRQSQTNILVARPRKLKEDLAEFTEPDVAELDGVAPMKGHDRVYYHTRNNQQIVNLLEFDYRGEDERAPDWLQEKTQDMIEEFTDVNEGEKSLMKLWNIHMLKKGYIADFSVALGCKTFVEEYGSCIIKNDMMGNFLVHLNNLFEFQVVPQSAVVQAMDCLFKMKQRMKED